MVERLIFWNIGKKNLNAQITDITSALTPTVFAFAEATNPNSITFALDQANIGKWREVINSNNLRVFSRLPESNIVLLQQSPRYVVLSITGILVSEFILCVAHLPSNLNSERATINSEARNLATDLRDIEKRRDVERSIIIGDLNLNPFDEGIMHLDGFAGMMTRHLVNKGAKTIYGKTFPLRYNPSWKLLGNETGPSGTAFYSRSDVSRQYWYCFDQAILSQGILDSIADSDIEILTTAGSTPLTDKDHIPLAKKFSDHLPISCRIHK